MSNKQKVNKLIQEEFYTDVYDPEFVPGVVEKIMEIFDFADLIEKVEKLKDDWNNSEAGQGAKLALDDVLQLKKGKGR
jgi:hypothetical protein